MKAKRSHYSLHLVVAQGDGDYGSRYLQVWSGESTWKLIEAAVRTAENEQQPCVVFRGRNTGAPIYETPEFDWNPKH